MSLLTAVCSPETQHGRGETLHIRGGIIPRWQQGSAAVGGLQGLRVRPLQVHRRGELQRGQNRWWIGTESTHISYVDLIQLSKA